MNGKIAAVAAAGTSKSKTATSEPTTTIRLSVELHELLKCVADKENCTLIALTESVLKDFTQRYEAISGTKLIRKPAPQKGLRSMGLLAG